MIPGAVVPEVRLPVEECEAGTVADVVYQIQVAPWIEFGNIHPGYEEVSQ